MIICNKAFDSTVKTFKYFSTEKNIFQEHNRSKDITSQEPSPVHQDLMFISWGNSLGCHTTTI